MRDVHLRCLVRIGLRGREGTARQLSLKKEECTACLQHSLGDTHTHTHTVPIESQPLLKPQRTVLVRGGRASIWRWSLKALLNALLRTLHLTPLRLAEGSLCGILSSVIQRRSEELLCKLQSTMIR